MWVGVRLECEGLRKYSILTAHKYVKLAAASPFYPISYLSRSTNDNMKHPYIISGIQQVGIGVSDVEQRWAWYRRAFGMDVPVFEEAAVADKMLPYTGGVPRSRYAALAISMQGGGGFEIWQYTERTPEAAKFEPQLGDLGIYVAKMKTRDIDAAYRHLAEMGASPITMTPEGKRHFYIADPGGNFFELCEADTFFSKTKHSNGGVYGVTIGVSDIDRSLTLYRDILGYDQVVYDTSDTFEDWTTLPGSEHRYRRVLLRHSSPRVGAFSKLLGPTEIELVQRLDGDAPRPIFKDRLWGDLGFIHLCFDVNRMAELKSTCEAAGFPFTVDSGESFDMGEAAGRFAYIEDPDGTLIEFVETHKVPILKKLNLYLNLRKRNPEKPLPYLVVRALGLNRKK